MRGLAGSLLVLAGALVITPLPSTTPLLDLAPLEVLRQRALGRMLGLGVVMAGLGMLGGAWLTLCRQASQATERASERHSAVTVVRRATVVWCLPLMVAPPLFSRDGWSYAAQGMMTYLGVSPYRFAPWILSGPIVDAVDPRWGGTPAPYGPLPLMIGAGAASMTDSPWLAVIAHRLAACVGLALLMWSIPRLSHWCGTNPALSSAVVLASPLMLTNGVGGLHNDLLMVGLMAAALVVAAERSWLLAVVIGAGAAAVKLPGGLVCIAIVLLSLPVAATMWQRIRRLFISVVVSVAVIVGLGIVGGVGVGWVHALGVPGTINTPLSVTTVVGGVLDWTVRLLGFETADATFLRLTRTVGTLGALGFAIWVAFRSPTGSREGAVTVTAALTGMCLLLSPVVHLWYLLWLIPFAAVLRLNRLGSIALYAVSLIAGLVAPLDSSLTGAYRAIVLGCMATGALTVLLLLTPSARARLERILDGSRSVRRMGASSRRAQAEAE